MIKSVETQGKDSVRVTATLPSEHYQALVALAEKSKVSVAWLIRQAVDMLLEEADGGPRLPFEQ